MKPSLYVLILTSLSLVAVARPSPGRTWIVDLNGTGDFTSVAAACEAAAAGDSIVIKPGDYREEEHDDPADLYIYVSGKPLSIIGDGPHGSVSLQMKFGFSGCDGMLLDNVEVHDVALAIQIWSGSYAIRGSRFERNVGRPTILSYDGSLVIEDTVFRDNHCSQVEGRGGAIWAGVDLAVRRCMFQRNEATYQGGAIFCMSNLVVEDCIFLENAARHGAAVAVGDGVITRSTFYRNDCVGEIGGAIQVFGDQLGMIPDHCIIAETVGAGIECPAVASALCCDQWMNQIEPDPWCGFDPDDGNFSADPLFCDPEGGDFGLLEGSPCLPGNHGGYDCGRIGAGAEYCGIIRTRDSTWGKLKMLWR